MRESKQIFWYRATIALCAIIWPTLLVAQGNTSISVCQWQTIGCAGLDQPTCNSTPFCIYRETCQNKFELACTEFFGSTADVIHRSDRELAPPGYSACSEVGYGQPNEQGLYCIAQDGPLQSYVYQKTGHGQEVEEFLYRTRSVISAAAHETPRSGWSPAIYVTSDGCSEFEDIPRARAIINGPVKARLRNDFDHPESDPILYIQANQTCSFFHIDGLAYFGFNPYYRFRVTKEGIDSEGPISCDQAAIDLQNLYSAGGQCYMVGPFICAELETTVCHRARVAPGCLLEYLEMDVPCNPS